MIGYLKHIDIKLLNYIENHLKNKMFDKIMPIITSLGNLGVIWIIISILLICKIDYRIMGVEVIVSLIITTIIGEGIIKNIVKRKRPFFYADQELLITKPITYSFPSGHTASSFAALAVFMQMNSKIGLIISPIATLIAFSRLYLKVHYPSDVLFGGILGLTCGFSTVYFIVR
ncbi:phosphatase PAP2 family protein [Clostridium celatum]|uniref:phosphatase PAP2 family protein n=1 Tax=Clostridium celatum TaxID=36834 RepID=UPI002902C41A|nr:phosphatase PAP2 family protein [Clostridium celatum]MDU2266545.1 phosphatase PAP2 family protein [Clostridium celatum]MDU3721858.1 phosphatase PAP2 family protein [Clostridium celatum]MDU6296883.1 phosphatase PAP2 family protein [Clostridium celatum]